MIWKTIINNIRKYEMMWKIIICNRHVCVVYRTVWMIWKIIIHVSYVVLMIWKIIINIVILVLLDCCRILSIMLIKIWKMIPFLCNKRCMQMIWKMIIWHHSVLAIVVSMLFCMVFRYWWPVQLLSCKLTIKRRNHNFRKQNVFRLVKIRTVEVGWCMVH